MSRQSPNLAPPDALRIRYRIRFAKTGLLRWISHRDLATLFERMARRAQLPLSMTEGFHQKPRMSFPSALPLGVESIDEVVEIELCESLNAAELKQRLIDDNQPGLSITAVTRIEGRQAKARLVAASYQIALPDGFDPKQQSCLHETIREFLKRADVSFVRKEKTIAFHPANQLEVLQLRHDGLHIKMVIGGGGALPKASDLMQLLGIEDWLERGSMIIRTKVHLADETEPTDQARTHEMVPTERQAALALTINSQPRTTYPGGVHVDSDIQPPSTHER
ncbi:MAG: TIGR03936 family radical SAM-associated protein [Planctomycetota bacterium]